MPTVEFFFDIISPYSAIQHELLMRQIPRWKSMQLKYTPVSIRGVFKGSSNPSPRSNPKKFTYLLRDILLVSEYCKIPLNVHETHKKLAETNDEVKTLSFLVAIQEKLQPEMFMKLVGKFFQEFFHPTESKYVGDVEVMKKLAAEIGIDQAIIDDSVARMNTDQVAEQLQQNTDRVVQLGAYGLPVTTIHQTEGEPRWVFGSDRMHIIGYLLGEKEPPLLRPE